MLNWIRLDQSLLSIFLALFESTELHYFRVLVDENAEAMRLELLVDVQVLPPEQETFVLSGGHLVALDEFCRYDQFVLHELLDVEDEGSVLIDAVLNVAVEANDFLLHAPEHGEVVLYLFFGFITNPLLPLKFPRLVLVVLGVLPGILHHRMLGCPRELRDSFWQFRRALRILRSANADRLLVVRRWPNGYGLCSLRELYANFLCLLLYRWRLRWRWHRIMRHLRMVIHKLLVKKVVRFVVLRSNFGRRRRRHLYRGVSAAVL